MESIIPMITKPVPIPFGMLLAILCSMAALFFAFGRRQGRREGQPKQEVMNGEMLRMRRQTARIEEERDHYRDRLNRARRQEVKARERDRMSA
ncbi:MAG: hypothetical protein AAF074_10920 [Pseudomonadota bacterium]